MYTESTIHPPRSQANALQSLCQAHRCHRGSLCQVMCDRGPEDGTLLDVSRKGARLCINRLFRPGQKLTLMMNLPWDEPPVEVRLATVKWVRQDTVGVEFLKVENDDRVLLDVFLASRSKLPAKVRWDQPI